MKVYLDNCCCNREFDDPNLPGNLAEARATTAILDLAANRIIAVVSSIVVRIEAEANTNTSERLVTLKKIGRCDEFVDFTPAI